MHGSDACETPSVSTRIDEAPQRCAGEEFVHLGACLVEGRKETEGEGADASREYGRSDWAGRAVDLV